MNVLAVPVARIALERHVILRHPLDEFERAGADGMLGEVLALLRRDLGRQDHAGPIGKLGEECARWRFQADPDRHRIDDVDMIDQRDLALAVAAGHRQVPLQRRVHCIGVERLAILEADAGPQMDHQRLRIGPLIAGGQLRHDVQLRIDVEQLVAHAGIDDAPDIGGGQGRIHRVEILPQRDFQRLRGCKRRSGQQQHGQNKASHGEGPRGCSLLMTANTVNAWTDQLGGGPSRWMTASITVRSNTPQGLSAPGRKRRNTAKRSRLTRCSRRSSASGSGWSSARISRSG